MKISNKKMFRTYGKTKTFFLKNNRNNRTKLWNDSPNRHQVLEFQVFDIDLRCSPIL